MPPPYKLFGGVHPPSALHAVIAAGAAMAHLVIPSLVHFQTNVPVASSLTQRLYLRRNSSHPRSANSSGLLWWRWKHGGGADGGSQAVLAAAAGLAAAWASVVLAVFWRRRWRRRTRRWRRGRRGRHWQRRRWWRWRVAGWTAETAPRTSRNRSFCRRNVLDRRTGGTRSSKSECLLYVAGTGSS